MVGSDPRTEMHTPTGRMDTVIITNDRIFLFEFKIEGTFGNTNTVEDFKGIDPIAK